jgi:hypothetical protein
MSLAGRPRPAGGRVNPGGKPVIHGPGAARPSADPAVTVTLNQMRVDAARIGDAAPTIASAARLAAVSALLHLCAEIAEGA